MKISFLKPLERCLIFKETNIHQEKLPSSRRMLALVYLLSRKNPNKMYFRALGLG